MDVVKNMLVHQILTIHNGKIANFWFSLERFRFQQDYHLDNTAQRVFFQHQFLTNELYQGIDRLLFTHHHLQCCQVTEEE
mgnify:CR=1 FL=1